MSKQSLNECPFCSGRGIVRCAYGDSITTPQIVWIECECGLRTPICRNAEQCVVTWNWITRESKKDILDKAKKKAFLEKIEKDNNVLEKAAKDLQKSRIKHSKDNSLDLKPKKRKRRTKAEMEEARRLEEEAKKKSNDSSTKHKRRKRSNR